MRLHLNTFLLCFFVIFNSVAQNDEALLRNMELLVTKIQKEHVKPRALDAAFSKDVHVQFVEYLDPAHVFFSTEDLASLSVSSGSLAQEMKDGKLNYFHTVVEKFALRKKAFNEELQRYLAKPIALNSTVSVNTDLWEQPVAQAEQMNRWKNELQYQVLEEMLALLAEDQRTFPADSIVPWEVKARKTVLESYTTYLERMDDSTLTASLFLNAIALSFDPHTNFFTVDIKNRFEEELSPERELFGFSMETNEQQQVVVSNVFPGSPAWLSNEVHEGAVVESIQFVSEGFYRLNEGKESLKQVSEAFQRNKSKQIELVILDDAGQSKKVFLQKDKVYSDGDVIKNALLKGTKNVGYITLPDFYVNWTDTSSLGCANDLAKCVMKLKKDAIEGLIIDLRGNGGGSLKEAVDLVGIFLDFGPVLGIKGKEGNVHVMKDFNRGMIYNGPLVVLIDEGSASASEIVAGALQDYNKAVIFGTQSFGKASSQRILSLDPAINDFSSGFLIENPELGYANITTGLLYRVTGKWNQKCGVTPDIPWSLAGKNTQECEQDFPTALIPDSITKKMNFTPNAPLPLANLKHASEARIGSDNVFTTYRQLQVSQEELEEKKRQFTLSLVKLLELRNARTDFEQKVDDFLENLPLNYQPQANSFDQEMYASNEVLSMYQKEFFHQLKTDVELMEAVNIVMDLINNPK